MIMSLWGLCLSCLGKNCCCCKSRKKVAKDEDVNVSVSNKIHISTAPHCEIHEVYEVSKGYLPMPLYTHRGKIKVVDEAGE